MATLDYVENSREVVFRELMPEIPSTTYATFGLYKYPAKFIPQIISYALSNYGQPGMTVLDPFAGYGTVGTVARLLGFNYELWDLNPLLNHLHPISIMNPSTLNEVDLIERISAFNEPYLPDWENLGYWFDESFLTILTNSWGYYHSLVDIEEKQLLLIPLLKATRAYSNNDEKRQKLSRSPLAQKRIDRLKSLEWESHFYSLIQKNITSIKKKLIEYQELKPINVSYKLRGGENSLTARPKKNIDIVVTSPPYLQAQEYIRATKMDLFWLGYREDLIRKLGKMEFPNQDVPEIPIYSKTFFDCLERIQEPHMRKMYQRYFWGVLGVLSNIEANVSSKLLLFVGPATVRTIPIPIDRILVEHFSTLGWRHQETLIDTIVSRAMFFYDHNPATGQQDQRMKTENLVVMTR